MMFDRLCHGRMLPIGYAIFFGSLLHNPGQRSIVSVAHKWAQMMDDMVIESAGKPSDQRVLGRVVGGRREDVMDPVIELVAVRGKVRAVDHVRGLEYERNAQTDNQMGKHESQSDQQRRFPQQDDRQNQHVGEIKGFPRKESDVFSHRMLRLFQIIVRGKEEALKVPQEHVVKRKQRVHQQRINVLEPLQSRTGSWGVNRKTPRPVSASSSPWRLMQEWWPR